MPIQVGSIVRGTMTPSGFRRRALVASIDERNDEASTLVCLIWEDEAPRAIQSTFLITPSHEAKETSLEESIVPLSAVSELFEFEEEDVNLASTRADESKTAAYWKECGDQLLRERDPGAAASFYELALHHTSQIQVGSLVLVQDSSKPGASAIRTADVDCVNEDENTVDITMDDDGSEKTIPLHHARLCLDPQQPELQERILLNLSRCLLLLAEQCSSSRRSAYLQSARLGCTLALAIPDPLKVESSLLLRSKAYLASNKFPQAFADVKALLAKDPTHREGAKLLQAIERQKVALAKTNKRLAKNVSRWVQTAMNQHDSTTDAVSSSTSQIVSAQENVPLDQASPALFRIPWMSLIITVLAAWLLQTVLTSK